MAGDEPNATSAAARTAPSSEQKKRALLVVNRNSRRAPELMELAVERLRSRETLEIVLVDCREANALSDIIIDHRDRVDLVIVGGGDGTMNAAARGLVQTRLPLGLLPLGTANDLARTLGIPEDVEAASEVILAGRVREIDCGEVNGRPFFNVASIGLSAELAGALTKDVKRRFGKLGYALTAIRVMIKARPFHATIEEEGERTRVLTFQVAVGNGRFYGGGMAVDEKAVIDDQMLRLYSLEMRRPWELALIAGAFRSGSHGALRDVRVRSGRDFTVTTRKPRGVDADGDIITRTPARFRILERAVRVLVPDVPGPGLSPR